MSDAPAAGDLIPDADPAKNLRVEYVTTTDVCVGNLHGDRWSILAEYVTLLRPAVRGGGPAEWAISPAWTTWDDTDALAVLY